MASLVGPRIASSLAVLAIVAAAGSGALGATFLIPEQAPEALRPGAELTSVPVQRQQFNDERMVPIALAITDATPLAANVGGRVTALRLNAGQELASGSSPLDVDGVPILALHTAVPLYRDLAIGSTGADVTALQNELARLGYATERPGYYGSRTSAALKDLKSKAGAIRPNGSLTLAEGLWLPAESVTPDTWTALLGSTVASGSGYGTVPGQLTAVTATLPGTLAPGARTLSLWGQNAAIDDGGRATDAAFLGAVMQTRDYAVAVAADDPSSLTARVALAAPVSALKVPPTALFGIDGQRACMQSGDAIFPVTVVGSALGASLVTLDEPTNDAEGADASRGSVLTEVALGDAITAKECR